MPPRRVNPFRPEPGGDPPALVGREAEQGIVRMMLAAARDGGSLRPTIFTGLRGMGKTALLRHSAGLAREDNAVVLYAEASRDASLASTMARDIAEAKRQVSPATRLRDTLGAVRKVLPATSVELPNEMGSIDFTLRTGSDEVPFQERLHDLNDAVRHSGRYLVLAIDEIQEANLPDLRDTIIFVHAVASTDRPVVFLGAGLTNSVQHLHEARTYTERWRYPRLECLTASETSDAIEIPAERLGVKFEPAALERLADETAGYPFFVQEYASSVWSVSSGSSISLRDVDAAIPGIRKDLEDQFYAPPFKRLTPRECAYVLALADLGAGSQPVSAVAEQFGLRSSEVSSIRNQLLKKHLLFASAPGMVEFRMPLTDRYIAAHRAEIEDRARAADLRRLPTERI